MSIVPNTARLSLAASAAALLLAAFSALAQEPEAPAAPEPPAAEPTGIEEIFVTTQKRAQNLQDVPISVTAITGDELSELGIAESVDIAAQTPGLEIGFPSGETNTPAIFLRGVGLNDYNANSNGSVGWYMDDVYISQVASQTFQLFDLERVEVARGPQGTLYGRNTTGGLVNFLSNKPSHDERDGYLKASVGRWNMFGVEGAYGGPITDTLAGRLSLTYNKGDGYIENTFPGGGLNNDVDNWAGRFALSWRPSDTIDVLLNVHGAQNRSLTAQYEHQGTNDPLTGSLCSRDQIRGDGCVDAFGYRDDEDNESGAYNKEGDLDVDTVGTFLKVDYEISDGLTLTSLSAYESVEKVFEEDTDASPNRLIEIDFLSDGWEFTQELRLAGESERVHWQAGIYYLNERVDVDNFLDLFRDLRPLAEAVDPALYPGGFDPAAAALGAPIFLSKTTYTQKVESAAGFGQVEVEIVERLNATLGFRYTWEGRDFSEDVSFEEPAPVGSVPVFSLRDDIDFKEWSGKIGLDYRPIEDLLLYFSVSRGFKSGGFNGSFAFDPAELPAFDSEILVDYEGGVKWDFLDNRVRLNASVFYYDYSDLQVFTVDAISNTQTITILDNAGQAKLYGGEIELEAQPLEGLDVALGLALLHSELTDYEANPCPLCPPADYSGNRLVFAPTVSWNGRVRYELPVGPGRVGLQTDWTYQSKTYFDTPNDPVVSEDGYWLWNARVSYAIEEGRWEFAAFLRNILDEDYLTYAFPLYSFGLAEQMWGRPRSFGVEATLRF